MVCTREGCVAGSLERGCFRAHAVSTSAQPFFPLWLCLISSHIPTQWAAGPEDLEHGLLSSFLGMCMAHDQPDPWGCVKVHLDSVTSPKLIYQFIPFRDLLSLVCPQGTLASIWWGFLLFFLPLLLKGKYPKSNVIPRSGKIYWCCVLSIPVNCWQTRVGIQLETWSSWASSKTQEVLKCRLLSLFCDLSWFLENWVSCVG